jgi:hypothetical protein
MAGKGRANSDVIESFMTTRQLPHVRGPRSRNHCPDHDQRGLANGAHGYNAGHKGIGKESFGIQHQRLRLALEIGSAMNRLRPHVYRRRDATPDVVSVRAVEMVSDADY